MIGTMLLLIGINLVKIYGGIIGGAPNTPDFGHLSMCCWRSPRTA